MCDLGTRDLQMLTKTLLASGTLTTPPTDEVARRARCIQQRRVRATAAGALALVLVATVSVRWAAQQSESSRVRVVDGPSTTTTTTTTGPAPLAGSGHAVVPSSPTSTSTTSATVPIVHTPKQLACTEGRNGGATDRGVTEDTIRVTMTGTLRFPDRYTTIAAYDAVREVFLAVNNLGGICGRLLDVRLVNPVWGTAPWDPVSDAVAGIAGPLDENADRAIADGRVDRSRTPVMSTGVTPVHFGSPWVWPVLPPAQTITRVAVDHAYHTLGARTFALVYEDDRTHGQAAVAFEEYVATLPDATVTRVQPLRPGDDSYEDESREVAKACAPIRCDFVLVAVSAGAIARWPEMELVRGATVTAGFPSFANSSFVRECVPLLLRPDCMQIQVWTGPGVAARPSHGLPVLPEETSDLSLVDSARVGAARLVEAMRRVGPGLTRERLRTAIDEIAAELSLMHTRPDGRRVFDIPVQASRPTVVVPFSELRPFTGWLRDPYNDWAVR